MDTKALKINNDGTAGAALHPVFATAYQIVKGDRGTQVSGCGPDGRVTGTCDRCGTAILNIYVFSDKAKTSWMHVGIDCARKMGVPVEALKSAQGFWRARLSAATDAVRRASREAKAAAEEIARKARLEANSALVEEVETLKANVNATAWEVDQLASMVGVIANYGGEWADPDTTDDGPFADRNEFRRSTLTCIRERLALCETSTPQVEAMTGKGKPAGFRKELRAYRKHIALDGQYGVTYVSFLTDGPNAYVYKGSHCYCMGETVEATWSIDGSDTRDGLTATRLKRPRKIAKTEAEIAESAQAVLEASWLESDRLLIANAVGVALSTVHYANAGRGLYVVESGDVRRAYQVCGFDWRPNGPKWEVSPNTLPPASGLVLWQGVE